MEASRAEPRLRLLKRPADRAFEQLYQRHAREVYQYALAVLANPTDAEDVTQTTFLNAYRAFQRGERPQKPHNWLIAITHNVCRMRWRAAGARPREVALEEAPEPVASEDERPSLDEVLGALADLSFNQRAALVMRELEGRSYQEIAELLGVSVSAVEALLFRARRRLRIHREGLGVITAVPLPGPLTSFLGAGGGGATAVGGAALGADVVLKAAAVVAATAVTAGVGYKSIAAVTKAPHIAVAAQAHQANASAARSAKAKPARSHRRTVVRQATPSNRTARRPSQPAASPGTPTTPPATQPSTGPASPVATTPTAALPKLPTLPSTPISVPTPQLPPAPQLPPVPAVPALPALPPVPPAPQLPPVPPLPVTVPIPPIPPVLGK